MVKTRNGNNYGTKQANSSDTNGDCNHNDNHNHNNDNNNNNNKKRKSKKDKKRVIEIEFFNSDGFGACKYCTYCPRCKTNKNKIYFNKIEDWRDHHESCHYNDCGYECPECDRNSQNWYNYTNHVQTHDSIPPAWNCIIDGCNLPFANIYSLLSHWKKNHTQYIIRKIPSRSTVADDLRILMGTYDLSGGEDKDKDDHQHRKKRGNNMSNGHGGRAPKRRKLNNNSYKTRRKAKRKHSDSDTSSDFILSSDSDIMSSSDEYTSNDTMNSINILNEIMKDIKPKPKPKPKKPLNHLNGIELLLKAVEMMGNKEKKKVDKDTDKDTDKENTNKKPLFNVEPIKPSNPLKNNSLVLPQQNHLFEPKQSSFQAKLPSLGPSFESSNTNILSLPNIVANPATAYATNINMIHKKQSQQIQHIPLNTPSQHIQYNYNNNINRPLLLQPQQQQPQPQLHYNNMSIIQNRYNRNQPRAQQLFISNRHQLTTYQQPTYQTFQVPLSHINHVNHANHVNHVNHVNGIHGINQQFAVVQSPNRSMMAVKIPLVLQQKVQQIPLQQMPLQQMQTMQPTVLHLHDFNQHNNNHRIHNINNINNISTNINNITHINNGISIIKNNQSTNSNNTPTTQSQSQSLSDNNSNHHDDIPELVDVSELVTSNTNKLHLPVLPILSLPTFPQKK